MTQRTWTVNDIATAAMMNANIRDPINALEIVQNAMELQYSAGQAVGSSAWSVLSMTAAPVYSSGTGLTGSSGGIYVSNTGRYLVTIVATIGGTTGSRRFVGAAQATLGAPSALNSAAYPGIPGASQNLFFAKEISFSAGDIIAAYVYQDSGTTLSVTSRSLTVRQIG